MKKILSIMAMILLAAAGVYGQSPSPGIFNYQGVARNSVGNVLVNKTITLRLTIHDGTAVGPTVYQESRSTITNPFGLFNVQVGSGGTITQTGTIAGVNWGVGNKYIQVEIDPNGGSTFINIGTAQIASVPYSLYSSLSNDLVLPFNKTQADAGTLFRVNNSGAGGGIMGTAVSGDGVRGTSTSAFGVSGATGASNGAGVLGDGAGTGNSSGVMGRSGEGSYPGFSTNAGVTGRANINYGVAGYALSGTGVYGSSNTGNSGRFENTNAANIAPTMIATTNGTSGNIAAILGIISSTTPGGFSAAVRGANNGTGGLGIGVWGSQAGSGWGVYGTADGGIGVNGSANSGIGVNGSSNTGTGGRFTTTSGLALHTTGGVRLQGIGEAANRILTSDASGNATWQAAAAVGVVTGSGTLNFVPKWTPSTTNLGNSLLFDDGTSMAIGTTTPTHRFTVQHTGSTGIGITSTSGFSVLDINAASGDAAIRFGNAGVNQWNMRNRPGDDYLEWFELGGGGSRMVIQDGTGNVGIGETTNPTYRLDVLHGGSTGIRSRSSGSFSVVDIDAASGDAALRFQKAGAGMWNTRNRPADDYYEIFELGGGGSRFVIQDGTGNVGIGETTSPSYRLDVLHGGSTGIRSRSSGSFSVVDIDAASGDAALRFANNGVNQWNTRNRPADDYYEIFELGGGGSRFVIQDGTGNVGIGETTSPAYKLDVLHGGATGARIRSSATFSVVDIDAASGDAALRFVKAGANQWNIRNRPADDYLEIFELGGGGSRMVIQDGTGNVGIGQTTSPSYRLDVEHGGATGIRVQSTATFSLIDNDAANGDAALRFARAGVNQWNIRNNPGTDDLQIFELGGGGERMRIENTTGRVVVDGDLHVAGTLSKAAGAFKIDHPMDPENKYLWHSFVESPDMMNIYNGNIVTDASGKATVQLPDYFEALNMEFRYQLTVIGAFAQAIISKEVAGNKFEVATSQPNVKVSWQVTGIRHDAVANMRRIPNAVEKEAQNKGKYLNPEAFGKPMSMAIGYTEDADPKSSSLYYVAPVSNKPAPATTGGSLDFVAPAPVTKNLDTKGSSVEDVPVVKQSNKPASDVKGTSVEDVKPAEKKAEIKPADTKGTSVETVPVKSVSEKTKTE